MYRQAVWDEPLLCEISRKGRRGSSITLDQELINEMADSSGFIPEKLRRTELPLPSLSEPQVVRHFTRLSQMNFGIDSGFYPLGSCTMKYNPKICEAVAANIRLRRLHPYQSESTVQGLLELLYRLSSLLTEITGMDSASLAPAAGAQGELVGAMIIRAHIQEKGELSNRNLMLIPDSAHGTNPASASMAGFKIIKIKSNKRGLVDIEELKAMADNRLAGIMLTNPNTLGLFESDIKEIIDIVHEAGGLTYYDGANMNALLGRVRPGDMGFDIAHLNLHKTLATPHGGGGPGSGPVTLISKLAKYLPVPVVDFDGKRYFLKYDLPRSIGRIKAFYGNIAVLVRCYVYLHLMGAEGLREVSTQSVLAANYLLSKINKSTYTIPFDGAKPRQHEFVASAMSLKSKSQVVASDIAKALLDEGFHSPSVYFPMIIDEALMVEPTETEPVEEIDRFASVLNRIAEKAMKNPITLKRCPLNTSIDRLDEVKASHPHTMKLKWGESRVKYE